MLEGVLITSDVWGDVTSAILVLLIACRGLTFVVEGQRLGSDRSAFEAASSMSRPTRFLLDRLSAKSTRLVLTSSGAVLVLCAILLAVALV